MTQPSWSENLTTFSDILDDNTVAEGPKHLLRIRCSKGREEGGEVEGELIAHEGSNPRKLQKVGYDDLKKELMDDATASLGALCHIARLEGKNPAHVVAMALDEHCEFLVERMTKAVEG